MMERYKEEMQRMYNDTAGRGREAVLEEAPAPVLEQREAPAPDLEQREAPAPDLEQRGIPLFPEVKQVPERRVIPKNAELPINPELLEKELTGTGVPAAEPANEIFEAEPEEIVPKSDVSQSGIGIIIVSVRSGEGAYPLKGARVVIDRVDVNDPAGRQELVSIRYTNESGRTLPTPVEAVPREYSLVPGNEGPFSTYFVNAVYDGYNPIRRRPVDVFGGETSLLELEMIPKPEGES